VTPLVTPSGPLSFSADDAQVAARALKGESFDLALAAWPNTPASGLMHAVGIPLQVGTTVATMTCAISGAGTGVTHGFLALYSPASVLLAQSADTPASFQGTGLVSLAMTASTTVATTGLYYGAVLVTTGTTMPTLAGTNFVFAGQLGAIGTGQRRAGQQAGLTAPPAPAVLVDGAATWTPWLAVR
jgi:hypothetical protein